MSDSIRRFLEEQKFLQRLIDPLEEARKLTRASAIAEALGMTNSLSHMFAQDEERHRQLAAIVDGYRVGGIGSEALLRMAGDAHQQHKLFGGAIEEARRLGLLDRDAQFGHTVRAAVEASRAYEQLFRRPTSEEVSLLATEAVRGSEIASRVFGEHDRLSDLRAKMEEMLNPWVNSNLASASARAFADLQSIGKLVNDANSFETSVAEILRTTLGDWRDLISPPVESLANPLFRTSLYVERGFDQTLTNFTAQAFDEGLEVALLWSQVDDGQAVGLDDGDEDGYARARIAFNVLQRFEIAVRRFIVEAMQAAYGDEWAKRQLPSGMYDRWREKKEAARRAGEDDRPLVEYADFTDYRMIIERKDNWDNVFKSIFGRPESIRESFQRLYPVRIATMHARIITLDDEIFLMAETKRVLRAIRLGA